MQETSGDFIDVIGGLHATTVGTITYAQSFGLGGIPNSAFFSGAGTGLSVADAVALRITGDVTIEVWFNANGVSTNQQIYSKGNQSYTQYFNSLGSIVFAADSVANYYVSNTGLILASTIYHFVSTRSGNTETGYLNGAAAAGASGSSSQAALGNAGTASTIANTGGVNPFGGKMAMLAIYNKALSAGQISAHYSARNSSAGGSTGTSNTAPPGQAVAALAHDRNLLRKEDQQPGRRLRISDYHKHRRHG